MTDAETRRLEMLIRIRQFGAARAAAFPAGSRGEELFGEIDSAISDLETHSTAQDAHRLGARQGTAMLSSVREDLREDLEAVRETARGIARTVPGADEKFRLSNKPRDQEMLTRARAFAQEAVPLKQEFVRRGMREDFIERLTADIDTFERLIDGRASDQGAGVAATTAIDEAIERGVSAVRELDSIVRNTFRDDAATLAEWTSASHVERAPRVQSPAHNKPQGEPAK